MDFAEVNCNGDCTEDTSTKKILSLNYADTCDVFGEPEILPRVGDEYQVEIPTLAKEYNLLWLKYSRNDANALGGISHKFLMGLPISVMWINKELAHERLESVDDSTGMSNKQDCVIPEYVGTTQIFSEGDGIKKSEVEVINLGESSNLASQQEMKIDIHQKHGDKGYPVPGSSGDMWSDTEEAAFLLGLYIFGKNFVLVKKFVDRKKMGDVMSFYYGKFYKTDKYRRWSECRKMRSRRCIFGQRIFTGLRQQELLSRLLPRVLKECQDTLLEVSKMFGEGKISLEEYVFTLKARVGLNTLVEAVGIGKGKEDLTGIAMDPLKSNQVVPLRPEIPVGKACSALTTWEIINFLTGDYRLSKARSSDLFWEAVWPRLLARGWHSEQPNDYSCAAGSKHSLVFLIPGVKRFSRRKLVKGNHYFDSVSDVLRKVASDPGLLELDVGADKGIGNKEENGWDNETKMEQDLPSQQRHYYLKPRTPNRGTDTIKFTVVDTSMACGGTFKVRELRSLPVEMNTSVCGSPSEESENDSSEESTDEFESADNVGSNRDESDTSKPKRALFDETVSSDQRASNRVFPTKNSSDSDKFSLKIGEDQKTNLCVDRQPRIAIKGQAKQRRGPDNRTHLAPVTKRRRRLTACTRTETMRFAANMLKDPKLKQNEANGFLDNVDSAENISSQGSLIMGSKGISYGRIWGDENPCEKPQPPKLIDLNLPISPDAEPEEPCVMGISDRLSDGISRESDDPNTLKTSTTTGGSEQQPNVESRRQSTRNRPLSTKALEALACGFLSTKQKRKSRDNPMSRPPRPARATVKVTEDFNVDGNVMSFKVEEIENGICNGEEFSKLQV